MNKIEKIIAGITIAGIIAAGYLYWRHPEAMKKADECANSLKPKIIREYVDQPIIDFVDKYIKKK